MRVLRAKQTRKYLRFFQIVFGLTAPYNVILDGNFVYTLMKLKLDLRDRLLKLLQGNEVKYFMLSSAFNELKAVGAKTKAAVDFVRAFCDIIDETTVVGSFETPGECLQAYLEQEHRNPRSGRKYLVATQDRDLRTAVAKIPGVPIIFANKVSVVLEPPSASSKAHGMGIESAKAELSKTETEVVQRAAAELATRGAGAGNEAPLQKQRVKRKALEANPLASAAPTPGSANSKKRKTNKYKK